MSVLRDIEQAIERQVTMLHRMTVTPLTIPVPTKVQNLVKSEAQNIEYAREEDSIGRYVRRKDAVHLFRKSETVRRVLRVEVSHGVEDDIMWSRDCPWRYEPMDKPGPRRIHDVDVYIVPGLPAPGWRVINPMEAK